MILSFSLKSSNSFLDNYPKGKLVLNRIFNYIVKLLFLSDYNDFNNSINPLLIEWSKTKEDFRVSLGNYEFLDPKYFPKNPEINAPTNGRKIIRYSNSILTF